MPKHQYQQHQANSGLTFLTDDQQWEHSFGGRPTIFMLTADDEPINQLFGDDLNKACVTYIVKAMYPDAQSVGFVVPASLDLICACSDADCDVRRYIEDNPDVRFAVAEIGFAGIGDFAPENGGAI